MADYDKYQFDPQATFLGRFQQAEERNRLLAQQQAQQERANKLADIQLRGAQRGEEEALAEREAYKNQDPLTALRAAGLNKQAVAYVEQQQKQRAAQITQAKNSLDLMKESTSKIIGNPNPEFAKRVLTQFGQVTGQDISADMADLEKLGNNPAAIQQWAAAHSLKADQLLPQFEKIDTGAGTQITAFNRVTGQPIAPQISTNEPVGAFQGRPQDVMNQLAAIADPTERTAATQAYQRQLAGQQMPQPATQGTFIPKGVSQAQQATEAREQQRIALEQRRVDLAEKEAQPKTQGLEALPPKEIQKREAVFPQATSAIKGYETKSDAFIKDLKALRDDPGLDQITGAIYGRTPSVSREGSRAQALYDKVTAKGGFQALQDLRDASKTGGALGNVSNTEGKQLIASFAAIDRRQAKEDVQAAIDQAIADIEVSKTRVREAYDSTYSYKTPAAPAAGKAKFLGFEK